MRPEGLSHIMHSLVGGDKWRKKKEERKPLNTSKEIKSRVKSNSRGIVKKGSVGGKRGGGLRIMQGTWQDFTSVTRWRAFVAY